MVLINCSSLINLPLIIYGEPGVGKIAMIRAYGRIRQNLLGKYDEEKPSFQIHTFHNGTKPSNIFGTNILKKEGKIEYVNGTLITSVEKGYIFIADEMNVSSPSTIKSLAFALEHNLNQGIYFSSVDKIIHPSRFYEFIACQNFVGTLGRNPIPESIASKFRIFDFPEQSEEDIQKICIEVKNGLYKKEEIKNFNDEDAKKVGSFMYHFNKTNIKYIPKWSYRDILKLFKRIHFQDQKKENYKMFNISLNLLFYITSPLNKNEITKYLDELLSIIGEIFNLDDETIRQYKECIKANPQIKQENGKNDLMKNDFGLSFDTFDELFKNDKLLNYLLFLPSFMNDLFKVVLASNDEPILLYGPTGYKTFLVQQFIKGIEIIRSIIRKS